MCIWSIRARPVSGKWSAHENLAHLARHHDIFLKRLQRILTESAPRLEQYRAEEDLSWPEWSALSAEEVLNRLGTLRRDIVSVVNRLSAAEMSRVGIHPLFGEMSLGMWIEFFLLHEAHHLYIVMTLLGQAKRSLNPD